MTFLQRPDFYDYNFDFKPSPPSNTTSETDIRERRAFPAIAVFLCIFWGAILLIFFSKKIYFYLLNRRVSHPPSPRPRSHFYMNIVNELNTV